MQIIYELGEKHIHQLHELYRQEWWTSTRTIEETRRAVNGSQITIGLVDRSDELLGFARVLTDYIFKAVIFDIIVRHDQRGKGFGDKILSLIEKHEKLAEVKHFELYCRPEMSDFYARHGFSTDIGGVRLMRRINLQ